MHSSAMASNVLGSNCLHLPFVARVVMHCYHPMNSIPQCIDTALVSAFLTSVFIFSDVI